MARREFLDEYDSPEVMDAAIKSMTMVLSTLKHRKTRTSVSGSIEGLKTIMNSLNSLKIDQEKLQRLQIQRKDKDKRSILMAKQAKQRWTDFDKKLVLTSEMSDFELGKKLGRSRYAVAGMRFRLLGRRFET
ncbi:MAG: hypothetical protein WCL27_11220 [Betaproteobacteria bacterium]